jgi:glycosyltransferase involved in cell wall biosynthesis
VKISIIIPTLNEKDYLQNLLRDIRKQNFKNYEVIVADANSKDETRNIAKKYGAQVVNGGLPGVGRNAGAKVSQGDFLFFLDADVRLPKDFFKKAYNEIQKRYLDLATCEFKPISRLIIDKVSFESANLLMKLSQFSIPHAPGFCILVSKRLFEKVHGFNESLKLAEDHDFVKRASVFRPLRILESTSIKISIRRLEKEGRASLIKKYLHVELYRIFRGEIKKNLIEYEFGNYNKEGKKRFESRLKKLEAQIYKINKNYKGISKNYFDREAITAKYKSNIDRLKKRFYNEQKLLLKYIKNLK